MRGLERGGKERERGEGKKKKMTRFDEGASAGKFALHFSRRTATPARTLLRRKERAGSFVSLRFVCFAHYPSLRDRRYIFYYYVRQFSRENN